MSQDCYEILQVHPRADDAAIVAAYVRLRDLYDPARLDGAADELVELARHKRDEIERAYAVLRDPARRASYDAELDATRQARALVEPAAGTTNGHAAPDEPFLDYRPLPPAHRAERPRGFDDRPVYAAAQGRQVSRGHAERLTASIVFAGMLALIAAIGLAMTRGDSPRPAAPASQPLPPTASPFDQFEALIPQARAAAEQDPANPQAWVDYGNLLYNSAEIVRENAPGSELYRQRVPRWLQATEAYGRALALDPANAAARADLGASACFYGAGTGDESFVRRGIDETRRAVQAAPDDPRAQLSLGHCLISAQPPQTQEAIASWRRVVQLAPPGSPLAAQAQDLIAQHSR